MRQAVHPMVPSRRVLQFLRSQSEGVPFFNASHGRCSQALGRRIPLALNACSKAPPRRFSTTSRPRGYTVTEARVLDRESILPTCLKARRQRSTASEPKQRVQRRFNSSHGDPYPDPPDAAIYKKSLKERLYGPAATKTAACPEKLDEERGMSDSIFNARRIQSAKAALEPRLKCTEVDENGEVILKDGEFKKSELIAKYGLMPRDLRKIDSSNLPHILVRPSVILLNLLHLKVLIKHNRVLLLDVYGTTTSFPQKTFMFDMQEKLRQKQPPGTAGGLPYEFRALEAVLMSVTAALEKNFEGVRDPVLHALSDLETDIDREKLRLLLVWSKRVSTFEQRARLVRDAIDELLEADDDLSQMYLTEKARDIRRGEDDHTEVEMLLESYQKVCDEVVQEASNLVSEIKNTEEIIRAILDANRNSLMLLELKFSVGTLAVAAATFIAGLYGMNLNNSIEETGWGFWTVSGGSFLLGLIVCRWGLVRLARVKRVRMEKSDKPPAHGHDSPHAWYRDDGPVAMLEEKNRERLRRISMMKERAPDQSKLKRWWKILR